MSPNQIVTSSQEPCSLVQIHFLFLLRPCGLALCVLTWKGVFWPPSTFPICEMLLVLAPTGHLECPLLRKQPRYVLILAGRIHASTFPGAFHIY